jgi:hypothetical protein
MPFDRRSHVPIVGFDFVIFQRDRRSAMIREGRLTVSYDKRRKTVPSVPELFSPQLILPKPGGRQLSFLLLVAIGSSTFFPLVCLNLLSFSLLSAWH